VKPEKAVLKHHICDDAGKEREEAGSLPFGFAQGRNDNQKGKSQNSKNKSNRNRKTHNKSTSSPASTEPELLRYG
jgi:hypothetical protein